MVPHIEYNGKMTLNLGERTFELIYLKNVHSEADTAVWMPKERVIVRRQRLLSRSTKSSADGGDR